MREMKRETGRSNKMTERKEPIKNRVRTPHTHKELRIISNNWLNKQIFVGSKEKS